MTYAPVEIAHIKLPKATFGYKKSAVDSALEEIRLSFEDVWRDRADLADKVEQLEADIVRYKELETLLRTTLISAERASQQLIDQARREAELSLEEAHAEARRVKHSAFEEREQLMSESIRIRHALTAALTTLSQADPAGQQQPASAEAARPSMPVPTPHHGPGRSAAA
jgi:cell division initiation protein